MGGLVEGSWCSHPFRMRMLWGGHTWDAAGGQHSRTHVPTLTHSCPGVGMLACECSRGSPGWPCTPQICPDPPWVTSVGLQPCGGTVRPPSRPLKSLLSSPGHRQHTLTQSRPQAAWPWYVQPPSQRAPEPPKPQQPCRGEVPTGVPMPAGFCPPPHPSAGGPRLPWSPPQQQGKARQAGSPHPGLAAAPSLPTTPGTGHRGASF